jgi:hypothetical protein
LERKEPKGPQPIAELVRGFLRQHGVALPAGDERIFTAWNEAAGTVWKARAVPVAFRAGQLTLEVASSLDLQELKSFRGEGFRAKANTGLGQTLIHKLAYKLRSR